MLANSRTTNVRFWHKADMARTIVCPLKTHSGHAGVSMGWKTADRLMTCFKRSGLTEISPVNGLP